MPTHRHTCRARGHTVPRKRTWDQRPTDMYTQGHTQIHTHTGMHASIHAQEYKNRAEAHRIHGGVHTQASAGMSPQNTQTGSDTQTYAPQAHGKASSRDTKERPKYHIHGRAASRGTQGPLSRRWKSGRNRLTWHTLALASDLGCLTTCPTGIRDQRSCHLPSTHLVWILLRPL